jgi:hypothetical protein
MRAEHEGVASTAPSPAPLDHQFTLPKVTPRPLPPAKPAAGW